MPRTLVSPVPLPGDRRSYVGPTDIRTVILNYKVASLIIKMLVSNTRQSRVILSLPHIQQCCTFTAACYHTQIVYIYLFNIFVLLTCMVKMLVQTFSQICMVKGVIIFVVLLKNKWVYISKILFLILSHKIGTFCIAYFSLIL